ncbi:MAG: hypothetical protein AB7V48_15960, partial [Sedimentibacter sp.]
IGHLVTTGSFSEEAKEIIEKFKDKLDIEVVDLDGLFSIMDEKSILPDNNYFYNKIADIKIIEKKKIKLKNNVFDIKKVIVYILAAVFFYIISFLMPYNSVSIFISYYFILLAVMSILYLIWVKYISEQAKS